MHYVMIFQKEEIWLCPIIEVQIEAQGGKLTFPHPQSKEMVPSICTRSLCFPHSGANLNIIHSLNSIKAALLLSTFYVNISRALFFLT